MVLVRRSLWLSVTVREVVSQSASPSVAVGEATSEAVAETETETVGETPASGGLTPPQTSQKPLLDLLQCSHNRQVQSAASVWALSSASGAETSIARCTPSAALMLVTSISRMLGCETPWGLLPREKIATGAVVSGATVAVRAGETISTGRW